MPEFPTRQQNFEALRRVTIWVVVPVGAVVVGILAVAKLREVPVTDLLRDPTATLDGAWYVGMFSTVGVALWAATAAMCLVALAAAPPPQLKRLLVAGAVVSLMLGFDDGLLLHETIKNNVGVPSMVTVGFYAVVALALFVPLSGYIASRADFVVLLVALVGFGISVALDFGGEAGLPTPPLAEVIEDVAKFLGIAVWAYYFGGVAAGAIRRDPGSDSPGIG